MLILPYFMMKTIASCLHQEHLCHSAKNQFKFMFTFISKYVPPEEVGVLLSSYVYRYKILHFNLMAPYSQFNFVYQQYLNENYTLTSTPQVSLVTCRQSY